MGVRLIPPAKPSLPELRPIVVDAVVLPVAFVEEGPLDINRATAAELEKLPGIGPALARRIVEWREIHGPFRSVEDLLQVPGIGPKTLEGIRDKITVMPP